MQEKEQPWLKLGKKGFLLPKEPFWQLKVEEDNSINSSWELIIPKTATGEEEESLRFNLAYNRVRKEKYAADREEINFT